MIHIDLFSGIGGFALAVDNVWGEENVEHIFCDNDNFCQAVLKKHWPNSKIYGDIRKFTAYSRSQEQRGVSSGERQEISETGESGVGDVADANGDGLQESRKEFKTSGDRQLLETATNPESGQPGESSERQGWEDFSGGDNKNTNKGIRRDSDKRVSTYGGIDLLTGGFP